MNRKIKVSELAEFDPSKYLDDDEAIADYIRLAIEDGHPGLLAAALGDVARARGMTQVAQAAGLIGHGVLVPGDKLSPDEGGNAFGFELALPADKVTVSISDAAGRPIRNIDLGSKQSGVNVLAWDGLNDSGQSVPAGSYRFSVEAVAGGQSISASTLHLGMVNSVSQGSQGVQLNLSASESVGYADIRQIF